MSEADMGEVWGLKPQNVRVNVYVKRNKCSVTCLEFIKFYQI